MKADITPASLADQALIEMGLRHADRLRAAAGPALPPVDENSASVRLLLATARHQTCENRKKSPVGGR